MPKSLTAGRIMFALGMIGLAILGIINRDFIVGRPPAWSATFEGINPILAYASALVIILCAVAIITGKYGHQAGVIIALMTLLFSVLRHLPVFTNDWVNGFKSMAIMGGGLIIAGSFKPDGERKNRLLLIGSIFLAAFFIASGYAHFKYLEFVRDLIPTFIPFRLFWAYFGGVCLIAGGIGILIPQTRRLAALLSGIMVLGWFLLLHIPRFLADTSNASDRMGVCESFLFSGVFFVLAGIYSKRS